MYFSEFHVQYNNLKEIALAYFPDDEDADAREQFVQDAAKDLIREYITSPENLIYGGNIAAIYKQLKDENCLPDKVPAPDVTSSVICESPNSSECTVAVYTDAASSESSAVSTDVTAAIAEASSTDVASSESTLISTGALTTVSIADTTAAATSTPTDDVPDVLSIDEALTDSSVPIHIAAAIGESSRASLDPVASADYFCDSVAVKIHNSADIPSEDSVASCELPSAVTSIRDSVAAQDLASAETHQRGPSFTPESPSADIEVLLHKFAASTAPSFDVLVMDVFPSENFGAAHAPVVGWACGPGPPIEVDKNQLMN